MSATTQLSFDQLSAPKPRGYAYLKQALALCEAVGDGKWRSLTEIEAALCFKYSQTGLSARIRDLHRGCVPGWTSEHMRDEKFNRHYYRVFRRDA